MSLICLTLMITYQNAMLHALFGRNGSFDMFNSMDYTTLCLGLPNTGGPHSIASGNIAAFFEWCLLISNSGVCILHMHVDIKKADSCTKARRALPNLRSLQRRESP